MENVNYTDSVQTEEVQKRKTLANCSLYEFLRQANKIRKTVSEYYDECGFGDILRSKPEFPAGSSKEEKEQIARSFAKKRLNDILDICLDTNVEKTVEVIGLMCFMEKEEAEQMAAADLLGLALELISSQEVVDFFSKMVQSGMINTEKS